MSDLKAHRPIVKTRVNNFDIGDKVIINKESPNYVEGGPLSTLIDGTIVFVNLSFEGYDDYQSIMVVWDDNSINLHTTLDIKLVDEASVLNRFTFDGEKIYFKDAIPATPDDVLPLLYSSGYKGAVATYYKNDKSVLEQCVNNKYRSFDDIYYLFKAYFPETTHNDVMIKLLTYNVTARDVENYQIPVQFASCSTMGRIRYTPGQSTASAESMLSQALRSTQYQSFKHWSELFGGIGISNTKDLEKFYADHFAKKA